MNYINRLLDIPSSDPDNARKGKLLNIILTGMTLLLTLELVFSVIAISYTGESAGTGLIIIGSITLLIGMVAIYYINKRWSSKIAASVFLTLLTIVVTLSDSLENISDGRSLFIFTIPIIMASMLLTPMSSFIFSALSSIIISAIAISIGRIPNIPAIGGYFIIALISWLSSRSLEQALKELRVINAELDHRVEERTRELSAALARELMEAGRTQAILEGIADGVIVFDLDGKSIVTNPALSHLLDIPLADLMGVSMYTILKKKDISQNEAKRILSVLASPSREIQNVRFRWGDRTLLVNASPVRTGLGDVIGTVAVFRDFTREAEIEQMKSTFVGMVSHELRTPLNAIIGYTEMVREAVYGPITAPQTSIMDRIENSAKRLLSLVSDLLDQAQIEAGKMKIQNAEVRISDLKDALHVILDKQIQDKGLQFFVEISPDMPAAIMGDSRRLQQIMLNLVGNALKFTETGSIIVNIHRVNAEHWGFNVTDTGPGISHEAQQFIFESFRQVEGVTTREHGGIGLGLAIVKSLVGLMGGDVSVSSEIGHGTTFMVTLPFEPPKEKK